MYGFCLDSEMTNRQLVDVIVKYLENNPEVRHMDAAETGITALSISFPISTCPAK